jgi:hypothetical protein
VWFAFNRLSPRRHAPGMTIAASAGRNSVRSSALRLLTVREREWGSKASRLLKEELSGLDPV